MRLLKSGCGRLPLAFVGLVAVLSLSAPSLADGLGALLGTETQGKNLFLIDPSVPDYRVIGPTPFEASLTGLAFDPGANVVFGVDILTQRLYTIDPGTGASTPIGTPGTLGNLEANALAFDPLQRVLYTVDRPGNSLYSIDVVTGVAAFIAVLGGGFWSVEGLGFDPTTQTLFGLADQQNRIVTIDPVTGETTPLASTMPAGLWRGLEYSVQDGVLYGTTVVDTNLYSIDPVTGSATLLGPLVGATAVHGLAEIPAPSVMIAVAVGAGAFLRRRPARVSC